VVIGISVFARLGTNYLPVSSKEDFEFSDFDGFENRSTPDPVGPLSFLAS
jgi:hypothetical protein